MKLGEIGIGRIKWLLRKCTAEKRRRPPLTGNIKYRLSVMASLIEKIVTYKHVACYCEFNKNVL